MMSSVFFRPKPLKSIVLKTNTSASFSGQVWLSGIGVIDNKLRSGNAYVDRLIGDANQWYVSYPGIYRVEIIGGGGGGGGGDTFYTGKGYGGKKGAYQNQIRTLKQSSSIVQSNGGAGGDANSSYGEIGDSAVNSSAVSILAGGGNGGAGSTNSVGASEAQRLGEPGEVASDGLAYGKGGDGAMPNMEGSRGGKGVIILTLIG